MDVSLPATTSAMKIVSMPRYRSNERDESNGVIYKDVCNPITAEFREELYTNILDAYARIKEPEKEETQKQERTKERRKMEVNENRGRLCRKKLQGKIRKKKNHQKEKDITGSVKRANHNKGSMIVSDPTELVQPGGNNHSSRFVRLCVGACFIHGAG